MMITDTEQLARSTNLDAVVIRALSSITPDQAGTITRAVHALRPDWDVQANVDYDGYLSLLIGPSIGDDEQNTVYVAGTAHRLELFQSYGDDMTPLGVFADLEHLLATLQDLVRHQ